MNLVKWFRKNKTKVMAIVVIVILFGFVGGGTLLQQLSRRRTGLHKTVAYFADNRKITNYDLVLAHRELEILKMLRADDVLRNVSVLPFRTPDLRAVVLGELLFSEQRISPELINRIKQVIRANEYRISDKQINDIYRRLMPSNIYWLLLRNEAQLAGVRISNDDSGRVLARTIPQLFNGATYSQLIGSIIKRQGISEEEILTIFGKLLAVLEYAKMVCSSEDVTNSQVRHNISFEEERIDVEFVKFDSAVFADTQSEPNEARIVEYFDKYKKFFAGAVSEANPYGFGYKLADRVQLEYIAVKLDDISGIVTASTQEEAEEYYQRYREQFTEQVPSDPNDPNSPLTERTKSYAEVASLILKSLLQNKINSKAESILREGMTLTEADFEETDINPANLSAEELRQMAGDYETTAEELSKKYKIKVYAGQTGLLSATDMQADKYLGMLYLTGHGQTLVGLNQVVFAIDELGVSELGPFDVAAPRMYENIGPMKDIFGRIVVVARVKKAEKASEPESINQTFSKSTLRFEQMPEPEDEDVYSVKEKVVEDLKRLTAMDTARSKAEEFKALAVKDGWESAVEKFNELYGQQAKQDESDPNVFELRNLTNLQRISSMKLGTMAVQSEGNPVGQFLVNNYKKEGQFRSQLYSLVPQDSNTVDTVPLVVEFKPDMSCYCLKEIYVKRLEQEQYEKIKAMRVYKEDFVQSQGLAAVHLNPENILKRMSFRQVEQENKAADANAPVESEEAL